MERTEYELMFEREDTHWWYVARRNLACSIIERWTGLGRQARILDVGCGTGGNLTALGRYGQAIGLDISPIALALAGRHHAGHLVRASSLTLPYACNTFDLITGFDVLYHRWIIDDGLVLSELHRVIRPGGWLLITDSALPILWSSHDQRYFARQRYTLDDLRQKLAKASFQPYICSYTNTLFLPIFLLLRLTMDWLPPARCLHERQVLPDWLNLWLTRFLSLETAWLQRGGTFPIGSSLIYLGQKPALREIEEPERTNSEAVAGII